MYILLNLFPDSGARKTEHIITHHMPPVKSGKSYFLSGEKTEVYNLVTQTIAHPEKKPHKKKEERWSTLLNATCYPFLERKIIFCHEM